MWGIPEIVTACEGAPVLVVEHEDHQVDNQEEHVGRNDAVFLVGELVVIVVVHMNFDV